MEKQNVNFGLELALSYGRGQLRTSEIFPRMPLPLKAPAFLTPQWLLNTFSSVPGYIQNVVSEPVSPCCISVKPPFPSSTLGPVASILFTVPHTVVKGKLA